MEPETDQAWTSGKYAYMRNWTYAYAADNTGSSKVKGKYKVAPLPAFEGGGKAGILGGHNSVISVYSKNPGLSLKLSDFYASPAFQKKLLLKFSQAAIIPSTYSEADVKKAIPYAPELLQALSQAKARPVSPDRLRHVVLLPRPGQALVRRGRAGPGPDGRELSADRRAVQDGDGRAALRARDGRRLLQHRGRHRRRRYVPRQVPQEPHPADVGILGEVLLQPGQPRLPAFQTRTRRSASTSATTATSRRVRARSASTAPRSSTTRRRPSPASRSTCGSSSSPRTPSRTATPP